MVYLWIILNSISHTYIFFFFEKYIFLFSYLEQKELSFTFLNKMWAEAHPSPVVVAFM